MRDCLSSVATAIFTVLPFRVANLAINNGSGFGTIFKMHSCRSVNHIGKVQWEAMARIQAPPVVKGSDGNFYGTTQYRRPQ